MKSAAEKMREYRKRLKEDPEKYEEYLAKAKRRKKANYVPVNQLTDRDKKRRREKSKEYVSRHRIKKRTEREANIQRETSMSESGYETIESGERLIVNMPFPSRKNGPRKRISRALSKKHREFKVLKERFQNLEKKYRSNLRCLQRIKKRQRQERSEVTDVTYSESPGKRTNQMMIEAGLNKHQRAKVRKQLLLANVMQSNVEKFRHGLKRGEIGLLRGLIGGKILRKYKLARAANKSTGLGRNRISKVTSSVTTTEIRKRNREVLRYKDRVIEFLNRDDNSRCNPGKQDKMKVNGDTHQTRILTDYLKNLHSKFLGENPDVKLSLASFCRIRPSYMKLTRFISRSCCLCTKHQNFALCTSALRRVGVTVPLNPERFIEDDTNVDRMKTETPEEIEFGQWKRVAIDDHGRKKMIMKVVSCTMKRDDLLRHMDEQIESFTSHVQRVKRQYAESLQIKKNLPSNEVVVNMDFAENYACKSVEEIQSAYWNQSAVTLHPVVIYHKDETGDLKHASIVIVSDEMGHNTNTVLTFLDNIVPEVKNLVPNVNKIHYYTDSPTSQYRNKTIFHLVANHEASYGCKAIWNFFEAGHGKGPCDGLGGTTKRMADEAVKTGKVTIQDADDFFQWTQSPFCSLRTVKFIFVPSTECQLKTNDTSRTTIKPVKGTMKIHAVVGKGHNIIETSTVSCYCDKCINGEACDLTHWTRETLITSEKTDDMNDTNQQDKTPLEDDPKEPNLSSLDVFPNDFVAAMYDKRVYVGKVLECDDKDGDVEITFMENSRKLLQWSKHEDRIWVDRKDIICKVAEPVPTGKSKRMFKLNALDREKVDSHLAVTDV